MQLDRSSGFSRFSTTELEGFVKRFPFLEQAQIALAKRYKDESHPNADTQLQLAALYAFDRTLLKEEMEAARANEVSAADEEELIQTISEEVTEPTAENLEEKKVEEEIIAVPVKEEEPLKVVESSTPNEFLANEPHTFSQWLSAFSQVNLPAVTPPSEEREKDELDLLIQSNVPSSVLQDLIEGETHYSKGLERFIDEQIQRSPVSNEETVRPTATDDQLDFATETMAKVYEMQKKYQKAIQTYEALRLKYPEKSDSFAARIQKLRGLL